LLVEHVFLNIVAIGVARGRQRGHAPKKIFLKYSHFVFWEAFFQTK